MDGGVLVSFFYITEGEKEDSRRRRPDEIPLEEMDLIFELEEAKRPTFEM